MQALHLMKDARYESARINKQQAVKTPELSVDALYLTPGQRHGPQRLDGDRAYLALAGRGELILEGTPDERIPLEPGVVALAPKGTWHALANTGTENLAVALLARFPLRVEERG